MPTNSEEMIVIKLHNGALDPPRAAEETIVENLWRVMKESLLVLQTEFALLGGD